MEVVDLLIYNTQVKYDQVAFWYALQRAHVGVVERSFSIPGIDYTTMDSYGMAPIQAVTIGGSKIVWSNYSRSANALQI
jgi:hypothetical protein